MGSGDLNMKKSWNPLRQPNQERVWKEEQKAAEEAKKVAQLQKELKAERELDELKRLQEEATGRKRVDRVEWMYSAPSSGSGNGATGGASSAELEDYLLGKKRVDSLLKGNEDAKLGRGGKLGGIPEEKRGHFQALQDPNNLRDVQTKISNDPLLAIKQQEQAAYQALLKNPQKLKELRARQGLEEPKHRRRDDRERHSRHNYHHEREDRHHHRHRERSRSRDRDRDPTNRGTSGSDVMRGEYHRRGERRREDSYPRAIRQDSYYRASPRDTRHEDRFHRDRRHEQSFSPEPNRHERLSTNPHFRSRSPPRRRGPSPTSSDADRAARLAAMQERAMDHENERSERLKVIRREERAREEEEEASRERTRKLSTSARFIRDEQRRMVSGVGSIGQSMLNRVGQSQLRGE